jgi:hypothetical protein
MFFSLANFSQRVIGLGFGNGFSRGKMVVGSGNFANTVVPSSEGRVG